MLVLYLFNVLLLLLIYLLFYFTNLVIILAHNDISFTLQTVKVFEQLINLSIYYIYFIILFIINIFGPRWRNTLLDRAT